MNASQNLKKRAANAAAAKKIAAAKVKKAPAIKKAAIPIKKVAAPKKVSVATRIKLFWWSPWRQRQKTMVMVLIALLIVVLVFSLTGRLPGAVGGPWGTGPDTSLNTTISTLRTDNAQLQEEKAKLKSENDQLLLDKDQLQADNAQLRATPTPATIIWPKTSRVITSEDARKLLTKTFPYAKYTGARGQGALYTVEDFRKIRSKMLPLVNNRLAWTPLIDKVIGMFQVPEIEDLLIGWADPIPDPLSLIVILSETETSEPKVFGFDPIDQNKIWEVPIDQVTTGRPVLFAIVR